MFRGLAWRSFPGWALPPPPNILLWAGLLVPWTPFKPILGLSCPTAWPRVGKPLPASETPVGKASLHAVFPRCPLLTCAPSLLPEGRLALLLPGDEIVSDTYSWPRTLCLGLLNDRERAEELPANPDTWRGSLECRSDRLPC